MSDATVQLQDFCQIVQGGRLGLSGNDFVPTGFPAYGAGGVNGFLPQHEFEGAAVVLSSIGARCGKCFYAEGRWTSLANTQLIFPDPSRADAKFLWYLLNDERRWHRSGTGQPFIKPLDVKQHRVTLPPLDEQRRITRILDSVEAIIVRRREAIALIDNLVDSVFLEMFGDPATNPMGWPEVALGDTLTAIRNGVDVEQHEQPGGWPITRIETIADGYINPQRVRWIRPDQSLTSDFQMDAGDILFSHINSVEHIAKTALYNGTPTPLVHGINLLRLRPKRERVDPRWLIHLLKHNAVRTFFRTRCKRAVNQASLNQADIKGLQMFLPDLLLQQAFACRVEAIDKLRATQREAMLASDLLLAALRQRALTGSI